MNYKRNSWNSSDIKNLITDLRSISDSKFKTFNDKIINTSSSTIGVQIPKLRRIAKEISKGNTLEFLNLEMPDIFELHILYALALCSIKDLKLSIFYLEKFLPKINNWAVCDLLCAEYKIVNSYKNYFIKYIEKLCKSQLEFTVRVGVILLLKFYIKDNIEESFKIISRIKLDKYYVNMGIAWTLSMCYIHHPNKTLDYLKSTNLNNYIIDKTYQKIIESNQVSSTDKNLVKQLRVVHRAQINM